jgi:hypothetical protein
MKYIRDERIWVAFRRPLHNLRFVGPTEGGLLSASRPSVCTGGPARGMVPAAPPQRPGPRRLPPVSACRHRCMGPQGLAEEPRADVVAPFSAIITVVFGRNSVREAVQ